MWVTVHQNNGRGLGDHLVVVAYLPLGTGKGQEQLSKGKGMLEARNTFFSSPSPSRLLTSSTFPSLSHTQDMHSTREANTRFQHSGPNLLTLLWQSAASMVLAYFGESKRKPHNTCLLTHLDTPACACRGCKGPFLWCTFSISTSTL